MHGSGSAWGWNSPGRLDIAGHEIDALADVSCPTPQLSKLLHCRDFPPRATCCRIVQRMTGDRYQDPEFRLRFARLVTHYWQHAVFLEEDQLIRDAPKLSGIPGVLIHGRFDVSGPLITAWRLSQRWTTCRLRVLDDAGHGGGNSFVPAVIVALDTLSD